VKVTINGKVTELNASISLSELLEKRGIKPGYAIVQYNGDILDKDSWADVVLRENDELEILRFVGGG